MKVAPQTINMIHGQLGPAKNHEEGFEVQANIQGQRVENNSDGSERFTPATFRYTARVINKDDILHWDIINIEFVL